MMVRLKDFRQAAETLLFASAILLPVALAKAQRPTLPHTHSQPTGRHHSPQSADRTLRHTSKRQDRGMQAHQQLCNNNKIFEICMNG